MSLSFAIFRISQNLDNAVPMLHVKQKQTFPSNTLQMNSYQICVLHVALTCNTIRKQYVDKVETFSLIWVSRLHGFITI